MTLRLTIIGMVCLGLWGFVTKMSLGLSEQFCRILDFATLGLWTREIFQMTNGFYYQVNNNDMPTIAFLIVFGIIFALVFSLIKPLEKSSSSCTTLWIVIVFSLLFRLVLLPGQPIHENDFYRYLWDGKSAMNGINPFKYAPSDLFMFENNHQKDYNDIYRNVTLKAKTFDREDQARLTTLIKLRDENVTYYDRIGHWQVPTIYPPVAQAVFWVSSKLRVDSFIFLKFVFMLFDMGVILLVMGLLAHFKMNPALAVIYGWSPLVLKEFANAGHYDAVAVFFTMLSVFLFVKSRRMTSAVTLALATLTKFFSGILLPILARALRPIHFLVFALIIAGAYVPYLLWNQTGFQGVFEGLGTYNQQWAYNGSLFALVYSVMKHISSSWVATYFPAKAVMGCLYLVFIAWLVRKKPEDDLQICHRAFLALAMLFLISPVGDPWYFCWSMPFLCLFRYRSWIFLSGLLMLSYLNFHSDIGWIRIQFFHIPLMNWVIYTPFFISWILERTWKAVRPQGGQLLFES